MIGSPAFKLIQNLKIKRSKGYVILNSYNVILQESNVNPFFPSFIKG
jgi:hypothetical protein